MHSTSDPKWKKEISQTQQKRLFESSVYQVFDVKRRRLQKKSRQIPSHGRFCQAANSHSYLVGGPLLEALRLLDFIISQRLQSIYHVHNEQDNTFANQILVYHSLNPVE